MIGLRHATMASVNRLTYKAKKRPILGSHYTEFVILEVYKLIISVSLFFQGMNGKFTKFTKLLVLCVIQKVKAVRELWMFIKNPRQEMIKSTKPRNIYPEILKNPLYGNHEFMQLQGLKLHYVESGPKNKELLLFVHGFPDFWFTWQHQIVEFSKDYWVVAIDMRGYGETEKSKNVSFYKINLLVDDLRNLVLKLGREKFTLIAHDWGGVVAHYFIRIYSQMLNKYILINTVFHPKLGGIFFSDFKQFLKSWYILIMQIPLYGEYFFLSNDLKKIEILYKDVLSSEELEIYKFMFGSYEKIRGPISYYRANFKEWRKNKAPNAKKLNKENVFGLYIHGENDVALTLNMAFTKSFEDVKNVELVCIPNTGHFVHRHSPKEVNKIIRNFLESNQKDGS